MSLPIKRAPRTYGRPKDVVSDEPNASLQQSGSAWGSRLANTVPVASHFTPEIAEYSHLSRQSSAVDVAEEQGSDEELNDASGGFQFSWKAKMKEIDEKMSEDEDDSAVPNIQDASYRAPQTHSPSIVPDKDAYGTVPTSPSAQQAPLLEQDVFSGSLSTLTASSVASDAPASPPITSRRRTKQRAVVTSDEEEDSDDDTKKSPEFPHPIASPKTRLSSTPPTSDEEMPSRIAPSSRSKGKGKPPTSRTQVPALRFDDEPISGHRKRPSEVPTKSKLRAPTKKDRLETVRDRGRIAVGQRAAVQHADNSGNLSLQTFFQNIGAPSGLRAHSALTRSATLDDPISSFSSSPGDRRAPSVSMEVVDDVLSPPPPLPETNVAPKVELRALDDSDDDENLPEITDILNVVKRDKTQAEKQRELMARKLKYAGDTTRHGIYDSEEDDDLEIGSASSNPKDIIVERASGSAHKPSEGRKRQLALGGVSRAQQRMKQNASPLKALPLTSGRRVTQEQLTKNLARLVAQTNVEATKRKEDEWVKRGGQVTAVAGGAEEGLVLRNDAIKVYAEQGRKNAEAREARMNIDLDDEDDDMSDADWTEEKDPGSTQVQEDSDAEDADTTMVNEDEGEDEENKSPSHLKSRVPRRTRAVIDSDSENDENAPPVAKSASVVLRESILQEDSDENLVSPVDLVGAAIHRGSASSTDERTEDEGDKENNTRLMYDRGDDKENKAVPRHPLGSRPGLGRQGSLFGLEDGMQRSLSMSPGDQEPTSEEENDENDAGGDKRRPLQNLLADEDPFLAAPGPSPVVDFAARLQQASPLSSQRTDAPESTLQASFDPAQFRTKGSSQFSDDESTGFKGAPLQPGFSDFFESGTEQQQKVPKRPLALSFSVESIAGLSALRKKNVSLDLTQDLEPAFEAGDVVKRQDAAIFEKEQGYLWETMNKKPETKTQELYVNDHGFLTQTRPEGEEAEVYMPSSPSQSGSFFGTQRSGLLEAHSSLRRPLRTLSLTESAGFDRSPSPLRRLAKRTRTPSPNSTRSSPSLSPARRAKNAFDLLRRDTLSMRAPRPKKPLLDKSEFVAEEAQESDDDEMMVFGENKRVAGDEEEDGEDLDRTLVTLVDDKDMDEETVAADRVLEKFQEHAHEDDLANEKLQQAVVQGELRKKRRNRGLGLDDSDDEDEEDEMRARKMRRGLNEPRIGSDISKLANDPNTSGFYEVYRGDLLNSDPAEFAYLEETQPEAGQDVEMESDDEGRQEVITAKELTEKLREAARQEYEPEEEFNAHDVTWVDDGDSDGETQTKVKAVSRQHEARNGAEIAQRERERLASWAKTEGRSRNAGTGRASGRNAVTGQVRAKTGGGSLRAGGQGATKPTETRRPLAAKPSVLTKVASERSTRFV
ncbi:hypothetical protein C8F04DRAFT_1286346 [Mycena alexandri]|uniref:DNA replication checkpoint mediator MRC1 domain-containing protein n=1 Tax=Mycena alexandri TaxID=1745969 RepID=A0AAD6TJD7_9AGAR|nr:hypothetical protein C8F04DRAFT_1286346 [Mycena alexandri]